MKQIQQIMVKCDTEGKEVTSETVAESVTKATTVKIL